jgi:hypothetical protein
MITSIQWLRQWRNIVIALTASVVCGCAVVDDLLIGQVAPLSGTLAPTGNQMVLGAKIYLTMSDYDDGGFPVHFSAVSHAGSNFVEVTVIGKNGKLMR